MGDEEERMRMAEEDNEEMKGKEQDEDVDIIRPSAEEIATIPEVKYEYLDHPADVQIHAWGQNLREAYEQAATAMFGYMTEIETVEMMEVREVEAVADDLQGLLFHFLDECLFMFCCEPFFIARKVVITDWDIGNTGAEGDEEMKECEERESVQAGNSDQYDKKGKEAENQECTGKETEGSHSEGVEISTTEKSEGQDEEMKNSEDDSRVGGDSDSVLRVRARLFGEEFQLGKHPQGTEVKAITYASMQVYNQPNQHEVFVIVDI